MSKKIKIAVAGVGRWGKNLVRQFHECGALESICDPSIEASQSLATQYGIPTRVWADILADPSIDGVVIASPALYHARMALEALGNGKHVFVEKPLCLTSEELTALKEATIVSKKILMVGHILQYHPAIKELKKLIAQDRLGKLLYIRSHRFNFGRIRSEENVLWSLCPHDISVILSLAGEFPTNIQANGKSGFNDTLEDWVTLKMQFPSGLEAEVNASWLYPFKDRNLIIAGQKGMVVFNDLLPWPHQLRYYPHVYDRKGIIVREEKKDPIDLPIGLEVEHLRLECQHFLDCIQGSCYPLTDISEGERVIRILIQAQACLSPINRT
ncbi:MAG: Gfo/Idh/MocA family oxidoreductase [Puniceicoccales bacterium]|jgi:predicted dehydrogenase|nr:Gfo/Idh/MocA family oxidoreductase [Puniceicoccales bacterium]